MTAGLIPLGDAYSLAKPHRRTRLVRIVLTAAIAGTAIVALLLTRQSGLQATPLLPPGSSGVIVLDLSASTENGTLDRMHAVLTQLSHSRGRFGVVVFSSRAYEALPPNTPASQLRPLGRFFRAIPPKAAPGLLPGGRNATYATAYPANPWATSFSFGTAISHGLDLARSMLLANHVRKPAVWLVSDLADEAQDRALVAESIRGYVEAGIALHVVALAASDTDLGYFARFVGARGSIVEAKPSSEVRLRAEHAFPVGLIVAGCTLSLLLALNELLTTPLRWGQP
jgi:hypothetical protein